MRTAVVLVIAFAASAKCVLYRDASRLALTEIALQCHGE